MPVGYAHIIPLWDADTLTGTSHDPVRGLPEGTRLTTLAPGASAGEDGVDIMPAGYAWLDKEKPCGERSAETSSPGVDWTWLSQSLVSG